MDFFNIGTGELLVLAFLALLLFGPEDMLKVARTLGKYTREFHQKWDEFSSSLEAEINAQEQESNNTAMQPSASSSQQSAQTEKPTAIAQDHGRTPTDAA